MSAIEKAILSRAEARSLTDEVKGDAERLWRKLVELYDGGAHVALGYSSWGVYFKTEFGQSERHGYRLLDAGRALEVVTHGSLAPAPNERQARELAPLLERPEKLRETWAEVVELHPEPTAAHVREVVARHIEDRPVTGRAETNAKAAARRLGTVLASIDGYRQGIDEVLRIDRALQVASTDEITEWLRIIRDTKKALTGLQHKLTEGRTDAA